MTHPHESAVIHDVRYSRFQGELRPRLYAVLALARSSAYRALGIRRSAGAKAWPFILLGAAYIPAIVAVGVPLLTGISSPLDVLSYWDLINLISLILVAYGATTLPSLLTRERRDRVLSLYFSTALSPMEYVAGKILAALMLLLVITLGPLLVVFVGGIIVADSPLQFAGDHLDELPRIILAAFLFAVHHAAIGLALGSLTARRVFAVGGYLAIMMVTPAVAGLLWFVSGENEAMFLIDMLSLPSALTTGLLDGPADPGPLPPTGPAWFVFVVVVIVGLGTVVARYRSGRDA